MSPKIKRTCQVVKPGGNTNNLDIAVDNFKNYNFLLIKNYNKKSLMCHVTKNKKTLQELNTELDQPLNLLISR
jgi:hypothetical protein